MRPDRRVQHASMQVHASACKHTSAHEHTKAVWVVGLLGGVVREEEDSHRGHACVQQGEAQAWGALAGEVSAWGALAWGALAWGALAGEVPWHGVPWQVRCRHGVPWHGVPWHGVPWHGVPWHEVPWHGVPWHGVPWHGKRRHGVDGQPQRPRMCAVGRSAGSGRATMLESLPVCILSGLGPRFWRPAANGSPVGYQSQVLACNIVVWPHHAINVLVVVAHVAACILPGRASTPPLRAPATAQVQLLLIAGRGHRHAQALHASARVHA